MKKYQVLLLVLFISSGFTALPAQSGWQLLNPHPSPEPLSEVSFEDANKGIAVGSTILTTADGGSNWTFSSSEADYLHDVEHLGPGVAVAVGNHGMIVRTTDSGQNWSTVSSGTSNNLVALSFADANVGYALGDRDTLLKTTDGGLNWISLSLGVSGTAILRDLDFGDATHGIIVGFDDDAQTELVVRTSDGGDSWTTLSTGEWRNLESIHMFDASNALIVGYGRLLRTTDGGETVTVVPSVPKTEGGYDIPLEAIDFLDANIGYILGGVSSPDSPGSPIFKTTDGGETWAGTWPTSQINDNEAYQLSFMYGISIADANTATFVGRSGDIVRTTDGGATWTRQNETWFPRYTSVDALHFIDANKGFVGGWSQGVASTADGGATWSSTELSSASPYETVFDFDFVDANTGYAVGGGYDAQFNEIHRIFTTTDGGASWTSQVKGFGRNFSAIEMIDAQTGVVIGFEGQIYRTTNGSTWNKVTSGTTGFLFDVAFGDANVGVVVGNNIGIDAAVLRTADAGVSWQKVSISSELFPAVSSGRLDGVAFASPTSVFAVGEGFAIIHSSDGGSTWSAQSSGIPPADFNNPGLRSIAFADENTGIAVGDMGVILRTTDQGATWTRLEGPYPGFQVSLSEVYFVDDKTAYIAGGDGTVLKTTSGGIVSVEESFNSNRTPARFNLEQNYPNPFNPSTTIEFTLPESEYVELKVYNIQGKELSTLLSGNLTQGNHAINYNGSNLASGVYIYRLVTKSGFSAARKFILIK